MEIQIRSTNKLKIQGSQSWFSSLHMFIPPSPKSQLHGSNFVYMNVLGIHPVNSTLVMKKPPGIIENNNVYFHHKMCPLIYQFQSEKKK